jgi:hypothetical protein
LRWQTAGVMTSCDFTFLQRAYTNDANEEVWHTLRPCGANWPSACKLRSAALCAVVCG